jgi:hypothetical protein
LFLDYEKSLDEVRRELLFSILQDRNIPKPLLTAVIKIYDTNEIKMKLDDKLTQPTKLIKDFGRAATFHRLYSTYIKFRLLQTGKKRR